MNFFRGFEGSVVSLTPSLSDAWKVGDCSHLGKGVGISICFQTVNRNGKMQHFFIYIFFYILSILTDLLSFKVDTCEYSADNSKTIDHM